MEEDIILLNDFIKGNFQKDKLENYKGSYKMGFFHYRDIQNAIENILKEIETYKKIAEKLAEHISNRCHYIDAYSNSCDVIEDSCYEDKECKQCILDWARKEVEKE